MGIIRYLLIFATLYLVYRLLRGIYRSFMAGFNGDSSQNQSRSSGKKEKKKGKINYQNTQIEDADYEEIK